MGEWAGPALGVAGTVCGICFGYLAFSRNKRKDDTEMGQQNGVVLTELGYIKASIDEVRAEQRDARKEQNNTNIEVLTRLAKVEASSAQAHKRLDGLAGQARA